MISEKCHCSGNVMKKIPEEIGYCINLVMLDFSNNAIDELPLGLAQCTRIEILHLGNIINFYDFIIMIIVYLYIVCICMRIFS
jgi:hypothetical protein